MSRDSILDISKGLCDENVQDQRLRNVLDTKAALLDTKPGSTIIDTASMNAYDPGENIIGHAATKDAIGGP